MLPQLGNEMRCSVDPHYVTVLTHFVTGLQNALGYQNAGLQLLRIVRNKSNQGFRTELFVNKRIQVK